MTNADTCPQCDGVGWLSSGAQTGAVGTGAPSGLVRCPCQAQASADRRYQQLAERSNLAVYHDKTFESFDDSWQGTSIAFMFAQRYSVNLPGWLILTGSYGVGKTHLAASVANLAFARGMAVHVAVWGDTLDDLRSTFDRSADSVSFETLFRQLKTIPLLVMDDIGAEKQSDWAREKTFQIMDYRATHRLSTIITSNRARLDIEPRSISRMAELAFESTIMTIHAKDYRQKDLHSGWFEPEPKPEPKPALKPVRHA